MIFASIHVIPVSMSSAVVHILMSLTTQSRSVPLHCISMVAMTLFPEIPSLVYIPVCSVHLITVPLTEIRSSQIQVAMTTASTSLDLVATSSRTTTSLVSLFVVSGSISLIHTISSLRTSSQGIATVSSLQVPLRPSSVTTLSTLRLQTPSP